MSHFTHEDRAAITTQDREPRKLTKADKVRTEREEARAELRALLKPGETVYTVLRHVSRSGMYRRISAYVMRDAGPEYEGKDRYYPYYLDRLILAAGLGDKPRGSHRDGVGVSGCGMDMGFHVVYNLGCVTFPEGSGWDNDGGYALNHRWI